MTTSLESAKLHLEIRHSNGTVTIMDATAQSVNLSTVGYAEHAPTLKVDLFGNVRYTVLTKKEEE